METQNGNEPTKNGPGRFGSSRFCFGGNAPLGCLHLFFFSVCHDIPNKVVLYFSSYY